MAEFHLSSERETRRLGASLAAKLRAGDVVLLYGDLGSGKTTLVRGYLEAMGVEETIRSPTFNLIQLFETSPPVLHADLYRVSGFQGLGLEDYLETHVCLIEWAEKAERLINESSAWRIWLAFAPVGRIARIEEPFP